MPLEPFISIVIATHNRRDVLLSTLARLRDLADEAASRAEIIVVDNASRDGTAEAAAANHPSVRLIPLDGNWGSCAKAFGIERARGEFLVFLDDDSHPHDGSLDAMLEKFAADDRLAAAGFQVHLPDGGRECSALPDVFIGCGVGLRRSAVTQVGGLDRSLFMQAEEYDLSFRLINAGWRVTTFDDLHVDHMKSPQARLGERTVYYDTRNNLLLAARYLPDPYAAIYRADWQQRYRWIARKCGQMRAYCEGRIVATARGCLERRRYADQRLRPEAFERIFRLREIEMRLASLRESGARRILLAGLGKNIHPFVRGGRNLGLELLGIGDDRFASSGRSYRGLPVIEMSDALGHRPEAIVIADTSPVHADALADRLRKMTDVPVYCWFGRQSVSEGASVSPAAGRRTRSQVSASALQPSPCP